MVGNFSRSSCQLHEKQFTDSSKLSVTVLLRSLRTHRVGSVLVCAVWPNGGESACEPTPSPAPPDGEGLRSERWREAYHWLRPLTKASFGLSRGISPPSLAALGLLPQLTNTANSSLGCGLRRWHFAWTYFRK
ncbi:PREDICTED: uncharacterized protein LOC105362226 [Ceratosolen solmsi marchali]|uniref:Uncharacterized protein LOC105362226 n=1 Tax=Ceratosolen solmsi marchali TaxID=326594 RepID=A0AAJ6YH15_9HYME|nr:PREDICTED: uncharacterized protein LOC105362226 [Ceratosolen solmsi marchali]